MRDRCPSAQFVAVAKLPKYRLAFTRKSKDRSCGVADVVADAANDVWGVVFDIPDAEFGKLDATEGFRPGRPLNRNSYNREQRHVLRDGDGDQPLLVWIYLGNAQHNPPPPNPDYKRLLVDGARYWHLPSNYVARLKRIRAHRMNLSKSENKLPNQ